MLLKKYTEQTAIININSFKMLRLRKRYKHKNYEIKKTMKFN